MAQSVFRGHLVFGLVSIPIRLNVAARDERVSFHQIHEPCNARVHQELVCNACNLPVPKNEIVKGYETGKDQYLIFSDAEIDKLKPESSKTIEVIEFIKVDQVDPIHFDLSYFVLPDQVGMYSYEVLYQAMSLAGYAAVAQVTLYQQEHLVLIRPYGRGLVIHTLFYPEEIRENLDFEERRELTLKNPKELDMAVALIQALARPKAELERYNDKYTAKVRSLIASKSGETPLTIPKRDKTEPTPKVKELAEVLAASIQSISAKRKTLHKDFPVKQIPQAKKRR